jgi:hypothetical protein
MGIDERKIVEMNTDEKEISNVLDQLGFGDDFKYQGIPNLVNSKTDSNENSGSSQQNK